MTTREWVPTTATLRDGETRNNTHARRCAEQLAVNEGTDPELFKADAEDLIGRRVRTPPHASDEDFLDVDGEIVGIEEDGTRIIKVRQGAVRCIRPTDHPLEFADGGEE